MNITSLPHRFKSRYKRRHPSVKESTFSLTYIWGRVYFSKYLSNVQMEPPPWHLLPTCTISTCSGAFISSVRIDKGFWWCKMLHTYLQQRQGHKVDLLSFENICLLNLICRCFNRAIYASASLECRAWFRSWDSHELAFWRRSFLMPSFRHWNALYWAIA